MTTLFYSGSVGVAPTFEQIQGLMKGLGAVDPQLADKYEIHVSGRFPVGLGDNEVIARIYTDNPEDTDIISDVLKKISVSKSPAPRVYIQLIKIEIVPWVLGWVT